MRIPGVGSWIERRAARSGEDPALVTGSKAFTYRELAASIRSVAAFLRARGIQPGDRVAFHGRNDPLALTSLFATTAIGAVWVPIHPSRPEDEVHAIIEGCEPRLLFRAEPATEPELAVPVVETGDIADEDEPLPSAGVDADELAIIVPTSGTTSAPKGAMLSHGNLLWNVLQMVPACAITAADVTLAATPFTRMGGIGVTVLPTFFAGGTVVVPEQVDGPAVIATIERAEVSVVFANPDLLEAMVRAPGWADADLSSVRTGVVGGGLVPQALLTTYLERGVLLRHGYGLTEAAPVVSLLDERDAVSHARTVGKPLPFVDVRVRSRDGSPCEPGQIGEWWIRGPNVCRGYWRRPPVHDADGWLPTGDVGSIDAEGYLTFVDRASAAIRVGGVTVYPTAIDAALYGAPGVMDASAVDVDGEIIAAVVPFANVAPDPEHLRGLMRDVVPGGVPCSVRLVDDLPRNAAGKVRRIELRARLSAAEDDP